MQGFLSLRGINTLSCGLICLRVSLWPARVVEVVCVLLSESVRECVMEGLQASWPLLSWGKNNHKHTQKVRQAHVLPAFGLGESFFGLKQPAVDLH